MTLPQLDIEYLEERDVVHQITSEGGMICIVLPSWQLPMGFDCAVSDLLIRLHQGYPDVQPDMWWFDPPVRLANGQDLPNTNVVEAYLGRRWQRWSRHFSNGQWQSGVDGLESYLALIRLSLERSTPKGAR